MEQELARVTKIFIGVEDHGILTINIDLNYEGGSSFQSFGGFSYGSVSMDSARSKWTAENRGSGGTALARTILALCDGFDVQNIADIKGKTCWAERNGDGMVERIKPLAFGRTPEWISLRQISKQDA